MLQIRAGFMLLMLVAFSSIILGLSVTFYMYCNRSLEDGQYAVRLANQRLALRAAINYLNQYTSQSGTSAKRENAQADKYTVALFPSAPSTTNVGPWVDINGTTSRGQNAGWYRIRTSSSSSSNNLVCITAGSGPSNGYQKPTTGAPTGWTNAKWNLEFRKSYFVSLASPAVAQALYTMGGSMPPVMNSLDGILTPTNVNYW